MKYTLNLAGRTFSIEWPAELRQDERYLPFLCPGDPGAPCDGVFSFAPGILPALPIDAQQQERRYYSPSHPEETWHLTESFGSLSAWVKDSPASLSMEGILSPDGLQAIHRTRNLIQLLQVERLLLRMGGMMLHASLISTSLGGIVFSGDCGIGKSTQAALWQAHRGAEVLNGDRAGIVPAHSGWEAWGLPYAGTSGIYINQGTPLRTVVLLGQGRENTVTPLSAAEAFRALYPQVNIHRWNPELCTLAADNLLKLLSAVPAYRLVCLPDASAVDCLYRALANPS